MAERIYRGSVEHGNQHSSGYSRQNIDYVLVSGQKLTVDNIIGKINASRERYFDLELTAAPIIPVTRMMDPRRVARMTETEKIQYDTSDYSFVGGADSDKRFATEFDYYAALIRAAEDNADQVSMLKRRTIAEYHVIQAEYSRVYDRCLLDNGRKEMGSNTDERRAWFHMNYPALYEAESLYSDFIEEIDVELVRWQDFGKAASRGLSAVELSYKATGKLFTNRSGKYYVE